MIDMDRRLSSYERTRILPLILWAEQTQTGDIAENSGFQLNQNWGLWSKLIAENNYCPGRSCKFYNECFLMRARNNARRADIVIVNHSLLFSDLVTDNSILGEYRNLVIDEAHNMEKTAGDYLGVRFNWWTFRNIYHKLYEEEPRKAGSLVQLEYRLAQSRMSETIAGRIQKQIDRLKNDCTILKRTTNEFFTQLNSRLRGKFQGQEKNGFEETKIRYHKNFRYFAELHDQIKELQLGLRQSRKNLTTLIDTLGELRSDSFQFQDQIHRELLSVEVDLEHLYNALEFCLIADEDRYVYWLELPTRITSNDVSFNAVPLNISELLKKTLYDRLDSAVFTSATLAVDKSFEYFKHRVGLDLIESKVTSEILGSPFDYEKQLLLAVPDFLEDPRSEQFNDQLADLIKETHKQHPTGMLVLFTNYGTLNRLYNQLQLYFESERVLLLAQGKSGSRTGIINQFREFRESILFGTDSFWEGIDVPGEALELLLIAKLPFDVPSEPLVAAKLEEIKKNGGNPFMEYSVPEAIIKFRQGFGRLIRHKDDFGAVIVCDNRLSRMRYGKQFLESLPVEAHIYEDKNSLFSDLKKWFHKRNHTSESIQVNHEAP
jgi:Rad3-related DNA helicase